MQVGRSILKIIFLKIFKYLIFKLLYVLLVKYELHEHFETSVFSIILRTNNRGLYAVPCVLGGSTLAPLHPYHSP